ncbi:hypothetical protein DFP72DRAFT_932515 [Ephemerocybe angulata]|uniref:Uncharacterized protein n=1 Tax=Ephemerocybe angulata TaxID=980116 RepID=A0A8H6HAT9_9AGAR|nr:hypothetical protein DFP72DRAFT_932515 [Tulosesus angulatus]
MTHQTKRPLRQAETLAKTFTIHSGGDAKRTRPSNCKQLGVYIPRCFERCIPSLHYAPRQFATLPQLRSSASITLDSLHGDGQDRAIPVTDSTPSPATYPPLARPPSNVGPHCGHVSRLLVRAPAALRTRLHLNRTSAPPIHVMSRVPCVDRHPATHIPRLPPAVPATTSPSIPSPRPSALSHSRDPAVPRRR